VIEIRCPGCSSIMDFRQSLVVVHPDGSARQLCLRCARAQLQREHVTRLPEPKVPLQLPVPR